MKLITDTLNAVITKTVQLLKKISPFDGPADPEAVAREPQHHNLDWANIIVVFCLSSAINIALLSLQLIHTHSQLPLIFYFLVLAILFAFTCFFVSKFIHATFPSMAQVLHRFGLFFGVTAFFISITIPFPSVWFKSTICFVYALSWFTIIICNYFYA